MTRSNNTTLWSALLLAVSASAAEAQEPRRVTLDESLRLAALNQPTMVQARQDLRVAEAQERQAFGAFLPTVSANMSTSKSGNQRIDQTTGQVRPTGLPYNDQYGLNASLLRDLAGETGSGAGSDRVPQVRVSSVK